MTIKIIQHGTDGFGHQLEGTIRMLSIALNGKAEYQYHYPKTYSFEHSNFNHTTLVNYMKTSIQYIEKHRPNPTDDTLAMNLPLDFSGRSFSEILNTPGYENFVYAYDGVPPRDPCLESYDEIKPNLPLLRAAFVECNTYLPTPSYSNDPRIHVCCHIRLGDAIGRLLDNEYLCQLVQEYQKEPEKYHITVHTNGDVEYLTSENTTVLGTDTDVLQVFSDFIHADVFITTYSALAISATLLAKKAQFLHYPRVAGSTFLHRVRPPNDSTDEHEFKIAI